MHFYTVPVFSTSRVGLNVLTTRGYLLAASCHPKHLVCVMRPLWHSAGRRSHPRIKLVTIFDQRRRRRVLIKPAGARLSGPVGASCFEVSLVVGREGRVRLRLLWQAAAASAAAARIVRSLHNAPEWATYSTPRGHNLRHAPKQTLASLSVHHCLLPTPQDAKFDRIWFSSHRLRAEFLWPLLLSTRPEKDFSQFSANKFAYISSDFFAL